MSNLCVKLCVYNNKRIIIENYDKLVDLTEDMIRVDIYSVIGLGLKVKAMDSYIIEITGTISKVIIGE